MNFKTKAMVFQILEKIPMGKSIYYYMQKELTKSLVMTDEKFLDAFSRKVLQHLKVIRRFGSVKLQDACFFEFGAGWNLLTPIGFSVVGGVNNYICVDLNELMHKQDILETIGYYNSNKKKISAMVSDCGLEDLCENTRTIEIRENVDDICDFLYKKCGICYKAPCDAGKTDLESDSIDYVIANTTLQHIPIKDMMRILMECYRLLKPGGLLSVTISYIDHYANADKKIGYYNFLQYSDDEWRKYSPMLHYQNRLRHSDYQKIFKKIGYETVDEQIYKIKDEYYLMLDSIVINEKWKDYEREDLVKTGSLFVLTKR